MKVWFILMFMLHRSNFTTPDWQALNMAIYGTAKYVSRSQKEGLFDEIRERSVIDPIIRKHQEKYEVSIIDDLLDYPVKLRLPKRFDHTAKAIESPVLHAIEVSVVALEKSEDIDLEIFRDLILDIAGSCAKKVGGITEAEQEAIEKIKKALRSKPKEVDNYYKPKF